MQPKKKYHNNNKSKKIWDLRKDESGRLKRGYNPITIINYGRLMSETTQVAKLFSSYFIEIAEKLQHNFNPWTNAHTTVNQKLSCSILFALTNHDKITAVIKGLKNKTLSGQDGFSNSLIKKSFTNLIKSLTS
jgi:hypothetical protein